MADTMAAGQDDGAGADPYIAGDVQRRGCLAPLMPHGDISPFKLVPATQEEDVLPHHQVIVDSDNPVEGFEVLADTHLVPDGEILPAAEIGTSLHNQFPALMCLILPEHVLADGPSDPHGQFTQNRRRGFGKETGETVIKNPIYHLLKNLPGDVDRQQPLRSYVIMWLAKQRPQGFRNGC